MKDLKLHTPNGLNDLLPNAFLRKRAVERRIEAVFERYGYAFVSCPSLEYISVFEGMGSIPSTEMYRFADRGGDILALRPDMTPAIARMAVTHFGADIRNKNPLRLCYTEKAFRNHKHLQGKDNEFTQAGAELIGFSSVEEDAEAVALAVHGLLAANLKNFRVDIGQVNFLPEILKETNFNENDCRAFMSHMITRDYVSAEKIAANDKTAAGHMLSDLTQLIGGADIAERVHKIIKAPQTREAVIYLEQVYAMLRDWGLDKYILLDLSMTGQLDYYTGIIFKGYAEGTGSTIVDGGRYNRLLSAFSGEKFENNYEEFPAQVKEDELIPAVGFGIKIEGLIEALNKQGAVFEYEAAETLLAYHESARSAALRTADAMRRQGVYMENSLANGNSGLEAHKTYAARRGLRGIIYFTDPDNVVLVNMETGQEQTVKVGELC